jgi:hypothetical protein
MKEQDSIERENLNDKGISHEGDIDRGKMPLSG